MNGPWVGWYPSGSDSFRAWVESGWIETTKLIIILGSVCCFVDGGRGEANFSKVLWSASLWNFFSKECTLAHFKPYSGIGGSLFSFF